MKFFRSFRFAWSGLIYALRSQFNMRTHVAALLVVVVAGLYWQVTATEWCVLLLAATVVIVAELMNTAMEELVDFVSPEHHPKAGRVKDIAAAAVLVASFFAAVVGFIIFGRYLLP
ncbi:MAG: diacylglycerol kinase family protein [Flammeovirgaceae bacterium]|nr:MAG: diacylglycerol kinase family protein [Flammeovirgaceae bacterium]